MGEGPKLGGSQINLIGHLLFFQGWAVGKRRVFLIGILEMTYPKPIDGTGVRGLHTCMDLAEGHRKALDRINSFDEVMTIILEQERVTLC